MSLPPPSLPGRRTLLRGALGACVLPAANWPRSSAAASAKPLQVGGLPVTCNLTLPVACVARAAANAAAKGSGPQFAFEYSKYNGWPEVKESLMAGRIQAAYMLAPLVMDLADKRIPVKIVSLGHRSGAVIMVRTDSPYQRFRDLAGKRIAIPSRFAVDFLFLRKMLAREGMTAKDIQIVEMAPPDMPAALYAKAVDAYCTGEPFGAAAQHAGYARPLRMTRDEWRNYICCVLTVREELIAREPAAGAGPRQPRARRRASGSTRSRRTATRRSPSPPAASTSTRIRTIIRFVMENPVDRVTYGDLRMIRAEFEELMQLSLEAGTIKAPVAYEKYMDESFAKAARAAVDRAVTDRAASIASLASRWLAPLLLAAAAAASAAPAAGPEGRRVRAAAPGARLRPARLRRQAS